MLLKKKIISMTALLLAVIIVALVSNINEETMLASSKTNQKPVIILDAGHEGLINTISRIKKKSCNYIDIF